jgi:hypothetical protein
MSFSLSSFFIFSHCKVKVCGGISMAEDYFIFVLQYSTAKVFKLRASKMLAESKNGELEDFLFETCDFDEGDVHYMVTKDGTLYHVEHAMSDAEVRG